MKHILLIMFILLLTKVVWCDTCTYSKTIVMDIIAEQWHCYDMEGRTTSSRCITYNEDGIFDITTIREYGEIYMSIKHLFWEQYSKNSSLYYKGTVFKMTLEILDYKGNRLLYEEEGG